MAEVTMLVQELRAQLDCTHGELWEKDLEEGKLQSVAKDAKAEAAETQQEVDRHVVRVTMLQQELSSDVAYSGSPIRLEHQCVLEKERGPSG